MPKKYALIDRGEIMNKRMSFNVNAKSQFAVLGLGKFGYSVAKELADSGRDVLCCDISARRVQEMSYHIENVVQADVTNDEFLSNIGIGNFDVVIVSFSKNFEDALLTVMKLKEKKVPIVIVKASDERHKQVLEKVGADYVILPEVVMGERLAHTLIHNDPLTYIYESDIYNIEQIVPKKAWLNQNLKNLDLRNRENINILGIIREDRLLNRITPNTTIREKDILITIKGTDSDE